MNGEKIIERLFIVVQEHITCCVLYSLRHLVNWVQQTLKHKSLGVLGVSLFIAVMSSLYISTTINCARHRTGKHVARSARFRRKKRRELTICFSCVDVTAYGIHTHTAPFFFVRSAYSIYMFFFPRSVLTRIKPSFSLLYALLYDDWPWMFWCVNFAVNADVVT